MRATHATGPALIRLWTAAAILALVAACSAQETDVKDTAIDLASETDGDGSEGQPECSGDLECDDGIECTIDLCVSGGVCSHTPVNRLCADDKICDAEEGCVDPGCTNNDQCSDDIGCTEDLCTTEGECTHIPDNDLCEGDQICSLTNGCNDPCGENKDCDNGNFCDGEEICRPEFGCQPPAAARDCNDNDPCTTDSCDTGLNRCVNTCVPSSTCTCPFDPNEAYNACYTLTPAAQVTCNMARFNITVSRVCFTLSGMALQASATPFRATAQILSQVPAPSSTDFSATAVISGGCEEQYEISGSFTNANQFQGQWRSTFVDHDGFSCGLAGCPNQSVAVTGDKAP